MCEANKIVLPQHGGLKSECEWRLQVSREVIATLGLEGLQFTESERKNIDRFVAGEIELDELRRIWDEGLPG